MLSLKNCKESNVNEYVKKCENQCLLIFWEDGCDIHSEAVGKGKFMNELEPKIAEMAKRVCKIREFQICDYIEKSFVDLD